VKRAVEGLGEDHSMTAPRSCRPAITKPNGAISTDLTPDALSEEVRAWYAGLTPSGRAVTDRVLERLASQGFMPRMPHAKPLGEDLHELRFICENVARRITYVLDPERQVATLTTLRKQRRNELGEVLRARRAQAAHEAARQAAHTTEETKQKGR
jgi:hypothetical protein